MKIPAIIQRKNKPDIRASVESVERDGFKVAPPLFLNLDNGIPAYKYVGKQYEAPAIYREIPLGPF